MKKWWADKLLGGGKGGGNGNETEAVAAEEEEENAVANYPADLPWVSLQDCQQSCPMSAECDQHEQVPPSLLSKINTSRELSTTVKPYAKHWLICTGDVQAQWAEKYEQVPKTLAACLQAQAGSRLHGRFRVIVNACDREPLGDGGVGIGVGQSHQLGNHPEQEEDEGMDVLVLPERLLFPRLRMAQVPELVRMFEPSSTSGSSSTVPVPTPTLPCVQLPSTITHIVLICSHKKRDKRCGVIGPMLREEFHQQLLARNWQDNVLVYQTTHYGGHKFAGNVIVYPEGHWYGRVQPCHVSLLVEQHLVQGKIVKELWRGQMTTVETNILSNGITSLE